MLLFIFLPEWVEYLNYPGLEIWKFADLAIFLTVAIYILQKPIKHALNARREAIRKQLADAQQERDQAAEKLTQAETMLGRIDQEVENLKRQAREEAELERKRQAASGEQEMERLKGQADRELEAASKAARRELQKFLANRSIQLAKESVISQLRPEDDVRLIRDRVNELRGARG